MTFSFKNIFEKNDNIENKTTANVVDTHLILSLPKAVDPIVWRMELKKTGAAAFEVKEDKDGLSLLQLRLTKASVETIAPFKNKTDAVEALMVASQALQNASQSSEKNTGTATTSSKTKNSSNKVTNTESANDNNSAMKWVIALMATVIIIALFTYLSNLIPKTSQISEQTSSSSFNGTPTTKKTGVPVSADDFLNGL